MEDGNRLFVSLPDEEEYVMHEEDEFGGMNGGMLGSWMTRVDEIRESMTDSESFDQISRTWQRIARVGTQIRSGLTSAAMILATSALVLLIPLLYEVDKEIGDGGPTSGGGSLSSDAAAANVVPGTVLSTAIDPAAAVVSGDSGAGK
uniref:Uncharacterized protein n=1 Tax=Compsopogon caeruleus TaxID=31354 RepID=A0A6T6CRC1_9RHOD